MPKGQPRGGGGAPGNTRAEEGGCLRGSCGPAAAASWPPVRTGTGETEEGRPGEAAKDGRQDEATTPASQSRGRRAALAGAAPGVF